MRMARNRATEGRRHTSHATVRWRWAAAALAVLTSIGWAGKASADDHRLVWRDEWPEFRASEYAYTTSAWASYLVVELWAPAIEYPGWKRPLPGELSVRRLLVARSRKARETAGLLSDVLWIGSQVHLWVDSAAVPLLFDEFNVGIAGRLALLDMEALGPTGLVNRLLHRTVGRERPSKIGCREDPSYEAACGYADAASFPSGHTSSSFVAAGLVCAHHRALPLYGHPAADAAACAGMLVVGAGNGVLRLVADRHWVSDVLAGAAFGFALGYGLPNLLHYGYEGPLTREAAGSVSLPDAAPARFPFRFGAPF